MNPRKAVPVVITIIAALVIIFGFFSPFKSDTPMQLPEGEQQVTGILRSVPLSATRRGTHMLEVDGKPFAFVESASKSLRPLEGVRVTVTGTFEENIDPKLLPVIIATDVRTKTLALMAVQDEELGISLNVPDEWSKEQEGLVMHFRADGSLNPILSIGTADTDEMPLGSSLVVGGEHAVSRNATTGSGKTIYIDVGEHILFLDFQPSATEEQDRVEELYEFQQVVLPSVRFNGASNSSASSTGTNTATGSQLGMPCGGEAGVLCPAGQYCEITEGNSGHCKAL